MHVHLYFPAGEDYESTTEILTFSMANQNTPVPVSVPITNDNDTEGIERFFGRLTSTEDRVTLSPDVTTISIIDDDGICIGTKPFCPFSLYTNDTLRV